jgi:chaperonin cofactor prefoldin
MEIFNAPNVSVATKTTEQNIQSMKSYLTEMADSLNYHIGFLENKIEAMQKEIDELKGELNVIK